MLLHISTLAKSTAAPPSPFLLHQSFWGDMESNMSTSWARIQTLEVNYFVEINGVLIITNIFYSQL